MSNNCLSCALTLIPIFIKCLYTGSLPAPDDAVEFSVDMICAYLETRIGVKGEKESWFQLATRLLLLVAKLLSAASLQSACWVIVCFLFEILYKHYHRQIQN